MSDEGALFSREEEILRASRNILNQADNLDTIDKKEYTDLLQYYEKLYKKIRRLVQLSDSQQSELQRLNETISHQHKALLALSREKTDFFINLAHEIKTPLTLIINYLNKYIKEKGLNDDLVVIKQNFDKLSHDIVNFMDFEKIERGQIFYDHEQTVNVSDLLAMKVRLFRETASGKNISITTDIEDEIFILMDPSAIDRIINNLIDNAIKYTNPDGKISIGLKKVKGTIELKVKDTGIGIEQVHLDKIFQPYYQLSHTKRNIQGIGMGLNIVKKILDDVGGAILIKSRPGKGSEFILSLKQHVPAASDKEQKPYETEPPPDTGKKVRVKEDKITGGKHNIFIVEDNEDMLAYLKNCMHGTYNVFTALNGKDALEKLKDIPLPDLILSDIMMDEMDGYEFYEELNRTKVFNAIPFIFITARSSQNEKMKAISRGAVDFIGKPFDIDELKVKIDALIGVHEAQKAASENEVEKRIIQAIRHKSRDDDVFYYFEDNCRRFGLTSREKEIARLLLKGKEDKEVAHDMNISYNTERTHVKHIYEKCRVQNKVELANVLKNP